MSIYDRRDEVVRQHKEYGQARRARLEQRLGFSPPPTRLDYESFRTDYGIGILGLHWVMQTMQIPAYEAARWNMAAACDIDEERIRETQSRHVPIKRYSRDWKEFLADEEVQVVDCCFGHRPGRQEHRLQVVEECAATGTHLLIAKPPATTLALAEQMAEIAEQGGIWLGVNQNCRYNPANYSVRHLLTPERLGAPRIIELQTYWRGDVHNARETMPAYISHTIHHADLIRWWAGSRCTSVYSKSCWTSTMTIYEFENGVVAYHMENHCGPQNHETTAKIMAERGVIRSGHSWNWHLPSAADHDWVTVWGDDTSGPGVDLELPVHVYEPMWAEINPWQPREGPYYDLAAPIAGMMGTLGSLMRAMDTGEAPDNHIDKSLAGLRMCQAAQISSRQGRPVDPDDVPDDFSGVM